MAITLTPPPPRGTGFFQQPLKLQKQPTAEAPSDLPQHVSQPWSGWFRNIFNVLRPGVTKDVVISGTTLHFVNGIFTGSSP